MRTPAFKTRTLLLNQKNKNKNKKTFGTDLAWEDVNINQLPLTNTVIAFLSEVVGEKTYDASTMLSMSHLVSGRHDV